MKKYTFDKVSYDNIEDNYKKNHSSINNLEITNFTDIQYMDDSKVGDKINEFQNSNINEIATNSEYKFITDAFLENIKNNYDDMLDYFYNIKKEYPQIESLFNEENSVYKKLVKSGKSSDDAMFISFLSVIFLYILASTPINF